MGERKAELPGRLPALISWGKRRWKLAAGACGVLLIALLVVLAYADIKYQAVRPAPRLRNAEWAGYTPDIRLVLQPALAAPVLRGVRPGGMPVGWLFRRSAPYEVSLIAHPDAAKGTLEAALFLNLKRFTPPLREQLNRVKIPASVGPLELEPSFQLVSPGVLVLEADAEIGESMYEQAASRIDNNGGGGASDASGEHLASLVLDNRRGALLRVVSVLSTAGLLPLAEAGVSEPAFADFVGNIEALTIAVDIVDPDELHVSVVLRGSDSAVTQDIECLGTLFVFIRYSIEYALVDPHGLTLTGDYTIEGKELHGEFSVTGLQELVARLIADSSTGSR